MAATKVSPKDFVQALKTWTVLDVKEALDMLENELGIKAAAPVAAAAAAPVAAAAPEGAEEEQTEFTVNLTEVGDSKINVIKAVRELTQLGLDLPGEPCGPDGQRQRHFGKRLRGHDREPLVPVLQRPRPAARPIAPDHDRRMGLLQRPQPNLHRRQLHELAVERRHLGGPELLPCQHPLPHHAPARRGLDTMREDLLLPP